MNKTDQNLSEEIIFPIINQLFHYYMAWLADANLKLFS